MFTKASAWPCVSLRDNPHGDQSGRYVNFSTLAKCKRGSPRHHEGLAGRDDMSASDEATADRRRQQFHREIDCCQHHACGGQRESCGATGEIEQRAYRPGLYSFPVESNIRAQRHDKFDLSRCDELKRKPQPLHIGASRAGFPGLPFLTRNWGE